MGNIRPADNVKLIVGLISNDVKLIENTVNRLEKELNSDIDFESDVTDFIHTEYYNEEMGTGLKRKFVTFKRTIPLENIEKTKLISNKIEKDCSSDNRRRINIDPGYLDLSKLVLFSTKDYTHRIHIGSNIFAEVTLYYKDDSFNPWPWTYPDYRTKEYISMFNSIRAKYKDSLKKDTR